VAGFKRLKPEEFRNSIVYSIVHGISYIPSKTMS
jgi:hypothetical protein